MGYLTRATIVQSPRSQEPFDLQDGASVEFLGVVRGEEHGFPIEEVHPRRIPELLAEPRHFHVIVGLDDESREKVGELPYKTVFLNWDVGPCPFDDGGTERAEEMYREIASHLRELMQILRGVDAA